MDPNKTWQSILALMGRADAGDGEVDDTRELLVEDLRNLADWIERGGFFPSLNPGDQS